MDRQLPDAGLVGGGNRDVPGGAPPPERCQSLCQDSVCSLAAWGLALSTFSPGDAVCSFAPTRTTLMSPPQTLLRARGDLRSLVGAVQPSPPNENALTPFTSNVLAVLPWTHLLLGPEP